MEDREKHLEFLARQAQELNMGYDMSLEKELLKLGAEKRPYEDNEEEYYLVLIIQPYVEYIYEPDTKEGYFEFTPEIINTTDIKEVKRMIKHFKK